MLHGHIWLAQHMSEYNNSFNISTPDAILTRLTIGQNCLSIPLYQVHYSTLLPIVVQIWAVGGSLALFSSHFSVFVVIVVQFLHAFLKFFHIYQVVMLSLDGTTTGLLDYLTQAWCNLQAFPAWAKAKQGVTWNVTKTWPTPRRPATAAAAAPAPGPIILQPVFSPFPREYWTVSWEWDFNMEVIMTPYRVYTLS